MPRYRRGKGIGRSRRPKGFRRVMRGVMRITRPAYRRLPKKLRAWRF